MERILQHVLDATLERADKEVGERVLHVTCGLLGESFPGRRPFPYPPPP